MSYEFLKKAINDNRAISDMSSMLCIKGSTGKYHFFMPVTNIPATGGAPDTQETTVTTSKVKTYIPARTDSPAMEFDVHNTIDNMAKCNEIKGQKNDFMIVYGNGTGVKFSGIINSWVDAVAVNNVSMMKLYVTVTASDDNYILNVRDLIVDTVTFISAIDDEYALPTTTGTKEIHIETLPAGATLAAESDATGVATVQVASGKITVTGVAEGTALIKVTGTAEGIEGNSTYFAVTVPAEA